MNHYIFPKCREEELDLLVERLFPTSVFPQSHGMSMAQPPICSSSCHSTANIFYPALFDHQGMPDFGFVPTDTVSPPLAPEQFMPQAPLPFLVQDTSTSLGIAPAMPISQFAPHLSSPACHPATVEPIPMHGYLDCAKLTAISLHDHAAKCYPHTGNPVLTRNAAPTLSASELLQRLTGSPASTASDSLTLSPGSHTQGSPSNMHEDNMLQHTPYLNCHSWPEEQQGWERVPRFNLDAIFPGLGQNGTAVASHAESTLCMTPFGNEQQLGALSAFAISSPTAATAAALSTTQAPGSFDMRVCQPDSFSGNSQQDGGSLLDTVISDIDISGRLPGRAYAKCSTAPLLRGQQLQHAAPADDGRASRQEKRKLHGPAATKRGKPGRGSAAYTPKVQSLAGRGKKNLPRKTQSREQKTILYKWIIDHIDHPFPNDDERKDLTDDGFAKSKFRWWFSNHRHRNLECVEDGNGQRSYRPKLTFYKACQRLGVAIPWEIPEDMRRQLKIAD